VTTFSVPQNSTAVADVDPVVEVSLVPDLPVATLALPLLAATRAAALACLPWVGRDQPKAATGVTGGTMLGRPQPIGSGWRTFSVTSRAWAQCCR